MNSPQIHTLRLTVILALLTAFSPFAIDMYLSSFTQLAQEFNTSETKVQLSLSVYFLGLSLGQLFYGPIVDRLGRKKPLQFGIALFTLCALGVAFAPNIDSLIVLRFLQAMGGCAGMIISRAIISDLFEEREAARILSLMMLIQGLAPIIAPILGGYIVSHFNWHGVFYFLTLFGFVCLCLASWQIPESLPADKRQKANFKQILSNYAESLSNPGILIPTLTASCIFGCLFSFISGSSFVYMQLYGVSQEEYGWLFGLNATGLICAAQLNRMLLKRFSSVQIIPFALLVNCIAALTLFIIGPHASLAVLIPLIWLTLCVVPVVGANTITIAMYASQRNKGVTSSVIGISQFMSASLASTLLGVFHNGTIYPMITLMLTFGILAFIIFFSGRRYL